MARTLRAKAPMSQARKSKRGDDIPSLGAAFEVLVQCWGGRRGHTPTEVTTLPGGGLEQ